MEHDRSSGHHHAPANFGRAFAVGVALNLAFVVGEVAFGTRANSVALLADAAHNMGDVLGLLAAWLASVLVTRPSTSRHTYGLKASSSLAALFNASVLLVTVGGIAWEAILRLAHPEPVRGSLVMIVAGIGIVINGSTALLFMAGSKEDMNLRAAFLHMASDTLAALGVLIAGLIILKTGQAWVDPGVSLLVVALTLWGTWGLLVQAVNAALNAVPERIKIEEVRKHLLGLAGVAAQHDLHVWGMSTTEVALTVHLVMPVPPRDPDVFLGRLADELHDRFEIEHATIQIECGDAEHPCPLAPTFET